ncbi:unnamed protein product [Cochlearia groenlandica]
MKRERKKPRFDHKEEKKEEERDMEVVVVVDALAEAATVAAAAAVKEEEEELWGIMRMKDGDVVVDEVMTWSTVWLPSCWDIEYVEKNYGVLFDDVLWDYDLWNLNISTNVPYNFR